MTRLDELKAGATLRHITEDIEAVIDRIDGDYIWVLKPGQPTPEKCLPGFWEIIGRVEYRAA